LNFFFFFWQRSNIIIITKNAIHETQVESIRISNQ
jgi:hypothetical protein